MTAFFNRYDAGRQLGIALVANRPADPVVIGLARGGVPVAAEVARILDAPLDICIVRKVTVGDLAIGAVAEGGIHLDGALIARHGITPRQVEAAVGRELAEIERSAELLRAGPARSLVGRDAILVDDGVTTGNTLRAAARALRRRTPRTLALAVPVASTGVLERLAGDFDHITCLEAEPFASAIGARYQQFLPVSEAEVVAVLVAIARERAELARPAQVHALGL